MTNLRIGHGFDAHRFAPGRALILGGADIPYGHGLGGHSDADVLCHAVIDALLGAAGERDIGTLFPDTDLAYKGISSLILLERVSDRLREKNITLVNCDCTVLCQAPRLSGHIAAMRANIAAALRCAPENINVKATTEEGMGYTGRGEGVAVHAVVLLEISEGVI